jgi:hypothetical protein
VQYDDMANFSHYDTRGVTTSQYLGKATKVGNWFATNKRGKCYIFAKILKKKIVNVLAPNQLHAKSLELAHVLAWQKLACNRSGPVSSNFR